MESIRPATQADLSELIKLVNMIFISADRKSVWMEEKFPIFLGEKNLDHLYIQTDSGKPVSHVGYYPSTILVEGGSIRIGSIGSVCTHPDYRGHGIASLILDEVETRARQEGIEVLLISGERSLYLRRKAIQTGRFIEATLENAQPESAPGVELLEYSTGDMPVMAAIYSREPIRFYRTLDEYSDLLTSGLVTFYGMDCKTYLVLDGDTAGAYFSLSIQDGWAQAGEYAGDRRLLNLALRQVMLKDGLNRLSVPIPSTDPLVSLLRGPGIIQKPSAQMGTVKILNAVKLMDSLRPYFLQRLPTSTVDAIRWAEQDGKVSLICGNDSLAFEDPTQLTRFIFGFEEPGAMDNTITTFLESHAEACRFAQDALPVPMPWAGNWNFI